MHVLFSAMGYPKNISLSFQELSQYHPPPHSLILKPVVQDYLLRYHDSRRTLSYTHELVHRVRLRVVSVW